MRKYTYLKFAFLVLAAAELFASGAAAQVTLLRGAILIDGSGAAPQSNVTAAFWQVCRIGQACFPVTPAHALGNGTFTFLSGQQASYLLGQCPRCRTIHWDEA